MLTTFIFVYTFFYTQKKYVNTKFLHLIAHSLFRIQIFKTCIMRLGGRSLDRCSSKLSRIKLTVELDEHELITLLLACLLVIQGVLE
jgi:hypothetical protein